MPSLRPGRLSRMTECSEKREFFGIGEAAFAFALASATEPVAKNVSFSDLRALRSKQTHLAYYLLGKSAAAARVVFRIFRSPLAPETLTRFATSEGAIPVRS